MRLQTLIFTTLMGIGTLHPVSVMAADQKSADFLSTALTGSDGRTHTFNEWHGKIRIVNFWATWCAPCRNEIPLLSSISREWQAKDVEVIGVAIDGADDVQAFVGETQIAYPILFGERLGQGLMQSGGNAIGALPFTILLDRRGRIIQRHAGAVDARLLKQWLADATVKH
jgi:thiol-disulfide isomerase/thioredoxin